MKSIILVILSVLISCFAEGQISNGSNFISTNFNFTFNPSSATPDEGETSKVTSNNSSNSYTAAINYGRFIKDNLAIYIGPSITHSESTNSSNTAFTDSTFNKNGSDNTSTQIALILGAKKFFPIWKQTLFLTFNSAVSVGFINSTSNSSSEYKDNNSDQSRGQSTANRGINASLNVGFGAYFFINKNWALTSTVNLFALNFTNTTGTNSNTSTYSWASPATTTNSSKTQSSNLNGQFTPSLNPFGLSWGLSYFF